MYSVAATLATATLASALPFLAPLADGATQALRWLLGLLNTIIRLIAEL